LAEEEECRCAREFHVGIGRERDYKAVKTFLNRVKFPAYIGPEMYTRLARNGGALLFFYREAFVGLFLINVRISCGIVLAVSHVHQGHGLAQAIVAYARPNFARPLVDFVPMARKMGYVEVGERKDAAVLSTQLMVRSELFGLAGRLGRLRQKPS
jgi:GNAT superfamily N-acetyltransferase